MMYHRDTETRGGLVQQELTERVIARRIEVHGALGPGLLESAYEKCLGHQFHPRGIGFDRQVPLPIRYQGIKLDGRYRCDLLVGDVGAIAINSASPLVNKVL